MKHTTIIGSGTWGAAVAMMLGKSKPNEKVFLYGRKEDDPEKMQETRLHPNLKEATFPDAVEITSDTNVLRDSDLILWVVPTPFSKSMAESLKEKIPPSIPIISLSKGIDQSSLLTVTEILKSVLGDEREYGCLSGPTHAEEVISGKPTGVAVAGTEPLVDLVIKKLHMTDFRIYYSDDLIGVELCGAIKNVIAIAAGICEGLQLGDNTKATLITRGLAEMKRLGRELGAKDQTFSGLSGMGDLLTTCYSEFGRNRALGISASKGKTADDFMNECGMIAEGAFTCKSVEKLIEKYGVDMPISKEVNAVLWQNKPVKKAICDLLGRTAKEENE